MKSSFINYFVLFVTCLIVGYCGWGLYRKHTIIENPVDQDTTYNLQAKPLLDSIEQSLAAPRTVTASRRTPPPEATLLLHKSNAHFDMARFYATLGNFAAADSHFKQITLSSDKTALLQIPLQKMFYAADKRDYQTILSIVIQADHFIEHVATIGAVTNDEDSSYLYYGFEQQSIKSALCSFAARILSERHRDEELAQLIALPHCADAKNNIEIYQAAAFLKDSGSRLQKFERLLTLVQGENDNTKPPTRIIPLVQSCLGPENSTLPTYASAAVQIETRMETEDSDSVLALGALFLAQPGKPDIAGQTAAKIKNESLRLTVFSSLYYQYLEAQDRENAFHMIDMMHADSGIKKQVAERVPYNRIDQYPSTLAYEIALKVDDPAKRVHILASLYNAAKTQRKDDIAFPNCTGENRHCLITAMKDAIETMGEKKNNQPLLNLARMQADFGDYEAAQESLNAAEMMYPPAANAKPKNLYRHKICTPELALPPQEKTDPDALDLLSQCNVKSGVYKDFVFSPQFDAFRTQSIETNIMADSYLAALVKYLAKDDRAEDALALIKKIETPTLRDNTARVLWKAMLPPHPSIRKDAAQHSLYKSQADRTTFLNNLLNDPFFKDNLSFWGNILSVNSDHFWQNQANRAAITPSEEKAWRNEIWAVHNKISTAKLHIKPPKCASQKFEDIASDECVIHQLIAQGHEQYAMNYSEAQDVAYTARQIILERLIRNNQRFRDGLNNGGTFHYTQIPENKCPI